MDVNLIDYTGAGQDDPLWAARLLVYTKNTRLEQSPETRSQIFQVWPAAKIEDELKYIATTIRSSWEFVDYTFQITGVTRAFTHQLVRTRTGSYAQQSQRSVGMEDFEAVMPKSFSGAPHRTFVWNNVLAMIRAGYRDLKENGVPTQDCRSLLPTNVSTNIIAKFNLRTLADLVGKRDNARAQGEYTDVVREMVKAVREAHSWVEPFLYPERKATPALDSLLAQALAGRTPLECPEINTALKELDSLKEVWG